MKMNRKGLTLIETLIGIALLAVIVGSILGVFLAVTRYFQDGLAMATSQATARMAIEKLVRPLIREGAGFNISDSGDTLTVTSYNGSTETFRFIENSNILKKGDATISVDVYRIPGTNIFEAVPGSDNLIAINFRVINEGEFGSDKEVRISTLIKLRN